MSEGTKDGIEGGRAAASPGEDPVIEMSRLCKHFEAGDHRIDVLKGVDLSLYRGDRVASHRRSSLQGRFTTVPEHMPPAHRHQAEWTPERIWRWAEKSGEATGTLIEAILLSRRHPQQGFRSCVGILRLAKRSITISGR